MASAPVARLRQAFDGLTLAATFLTIAPLPVRRDVQSRWTAAWFPLVGAVVGAAAGGVRIGLDRALGPGPAAALAVVTLIVLTGALHQDGLADCADGLGVRGDRARRLAVMREPQVGVFGVLAVALWLLVLVLALAGLPRVDALSALIVACALARWAALAHATATAPARRDGLGAAFDVGAGPLVLASVSAVGVSFVFTPPLRALTVLAAAVVTAGLVSLWARRAVGGRTGDTLGATVALTELVVCLVLLVFARG